MFDPLVDTLVFLTVSFILGLALGWTLWKFGTTQQVAGEATEAEFWQERLNQTRQERDLSKQRIEALEKEREDLMKRIKKS